MGVILLNASTPVYRTPIQPSPVKGEGFRIEGGSRSQSRVMFAQCIPDADHWIHADASWCVTVIFSAR